MKAIFLAGTCVLVSVLAFCGIAACTNPQQDESEAAAVTESDTLEAADIQLAGSVRLVTGSGLAVRALTLSLYGEESCAPESLLARLQLEVAAGAGDTEAAWASPVPAGTSAAYFTLDAEDEAGFRFQTEAAGFTVPPDGAENIALNAEYAPAGLGVLAFGAAANSGIVPFFAAPDAAGGYTFTTLQWLDAIDSLKASFYTAGTVSVNGVVQQSGVSANDFRQPLTYIVGTAGTGTAYQVALESPQTTGHAVLRIDTQGRDITSTTDWLTGASYTLHAPDADPISGALDIKGRGNTTWWMPKKSYAIKLAQKTELLGMPEHKRWQLLANYVDTSLLRTEAAFKLGEIFDNLAWTPRSHQVYIYLNNTFAGVYQLTEAIKIDTHRVNISKTISKKKNPEGGYILEIDARRGEAFNFTTTRGVVFCCSDPDEDLDDIFDVSTGRTGTLFEKIQQDVQSAEDVLYSENFTDAAEGWQKYLDADSFVDWYLVNEITKNNDAIFYLSVYMYFDFDKQKLCMGPLWDFDLALGNYVFDSRNATNNPAGFWIKGAPWIRRLFEDPYFASLVSARWAEKKAEAAAVAAFIDDRAAYLERAQRLNRMKWPVGGAYLSLLKAS